MRTVDVAVVGAGLAGSLTAAMLGRAGTSAVLIDPHTAYPPDFRCEKIDGSQMRILRRTGLADAVMRAATHDGGVWIARLGHLVDKRPGDQHGILYQDLVAAVRAEVPASVPFIKAKVAAIAAGDEHQRLVTSTGEYVSARLVVLATGLNLGLRSSLGIEREDVSKTHSIMLGFDLDPVGRAAFDFPALTYYGERAADRTAYITLFPVRNTMRANLCVYRGLDDLWLREFRQAPTETLRALMPGLSKLAGDYAVSGEVKIRPADLYVVKNYRRAGVVLVGDAFATSCPTAGTGTSKVFTDVERLCNVYIPRWLASDGMGAIKISAFYDDPVKQACDAHSATKAFHLRSLTIEPGLTWQAQRLAQFVGRLGVGMLRQASARLKAASHDDGGDVSRAA